MRKRTKVIFAAVACLVGLASQPFLRTKEYARLKSPNGDFYAVVTYPVWKSYFPMMPGQAGDKSGVITIYTAMGESCGRVPVEMVSSVRDLEWGEKRAEIRFVAEWDLLQRQARAIR